MSTQPRIYLDHNATTPLAAPAAAAMAAAMRVGGNPSSIHADGRAARDLVERARASVAQLLARPREQVVFTSGGSEGNALAIAALAGAAEAAGRPRIAWTTPMEHPSLAHPLAALAGRGWTIRELAARADGSVELPAAEPAGVVAAAWVHHELGVVRDVAALVAFARACGALVHVDAVQAAGKLPLAACAADAIAVSAHKLGGPAGAGAVALAPAADRAAPLTGGHQERGRRGGTENVVGIAGFGAAAREAAAAVARWPDVCALGARLEAGLAALAGVAIAAAAVPRVGGTTLAMFDGARGESIAIALDLAGISVSTGAACTSGTLQPVAALLAMGYSPDRARSAVRFSLGRSTTAAEVDAVLAVLPGIVDRARGARGRSA